MVSVIFTCSHPKTARIRFILDGQVLRTKKEGLEKDIIKLELPEGQHTLTISTKSWYDTPWCYLQILNPLFYLWHFKFVFHWHLVYDDSFASVQISFFLKESQKNVYFNTSLKFRERHDMDGSIGTCLEIEYQKPENVKNFKAQKIAMPQKVKSRFQKVHLLSALFYGVVFAILCVAGCFLEEDIWTMITGGVCGIAASAIMAVRTVQAKSVDDIIKNKNKSPQSKF